MENDTSVQGSKNSGALIGAVIIIIILILGGIYLSKNKAGEQIQEQEKMEEKANTLSTSDELGDIEADLNNNAGIDSLDMSLE